MRLDWKWDGLIRRRPWLLPLLLMMLLGGRPGRAQSGPGFGYGPGRPARAERGVAWRERQAEHLYLTGRRLIEQGFYGEGLEALNQSLALRPGHPRALTYKGIALRALREPRLALEQFNAALAADPDDGVAHGERGLTYIVLGDETRGEDDLDRATRARPDLAQWFAQQRRWMAANRASIDLDAAEPGQALPPAAPTPVAVTADNDGTPGPDAKSPLALLDRVGAWSLVKPALFMAGAFLLALLGIRVVFAILSALLRRVRRPWKSSRMRELRDGSGPFGRPAEGYAADASVSQPDVEIASRPSFRRRYRGLLITAVAGLAIMGMFALPVLVQAFQLDADRLVAPRVRPSVLDYRGNVYTHLGVPDTPIEFKDLPTHLVDALRAREDSRFFEHNGIDWYGLARAFVTDITHLRIKQGASTLTMQLAEKVYSLDQDGLLNRLRSKLVEWTMARRGEAALAHKLGDKRAAKEAIMTAYLNRVEFGGGTVGVGAASYYYFDKPVSELTLGESCMLVALLRAPTANSPYRNPDNSRLARDSIVAQMVRRGYITDEQGKQAKFFVVENPRRPQPEHNGYLVAAITREMNTLKAGKKLPADVWNHEDLTIGTTLDLWAQEILDSEIRKVTASFKGDTEDDPLGGAGMIVDNATGQIRALVSGQDYSKSQYDLALLSWRQVASIAKPFVYGAYLERGGDIASLASNGPLTSDEVRSLNGWNPKNSSSLKEGQYPLSTGLAFSDNLITARVGLSAGLKRVYNTLYTAGLVSDKSTTGVTWLLGTFDSSLANVVSAYTAFPRGGSRAVPYLVESVFIGGKEVYRAKPQSVPLFSRRTAEQVHRALREAMTDGTGRTAVKNAGLDALVAGKTGTSQNAADVWWVGYVKEVTLGVRFGRDSNKSLGNAAGGTMSAPVAARVLKKLSERYELDDAH